MHKPPQPPASWSITQSAGTMGPMCIQYTGTSGSEIVGNEDCLYLNVYTPVVSSKL